MRVDRYVKGSEIVATSEGRIINRLRVRQMFPGQTYALDRSWCESIIAESSPKLELSIEVAT